MVSKPGSSEPVQSATSTPVTVTWGPPGGPKVIATMVKIDNKMDRRLVRQEEGTKTLIIQGIKRQTEL